MESKLASGFPETPEVTRREVHSRRIEMRGYLRSDGLYEVEGRVTDRKADDFAPASSDRFVKAGEPIHDMGVRLVYDAQLLVHDVQAFTAAAPYAACPEAVHAMQSIKGLRMSKGWSAEVRSRLGGARGCTHLMELLMPMATTAFQSLSASRAGQPDALDATGRPVKIDSCFAYAADGELVRQRWPLHHRPKPAP